MKKYMLLLLLIFACGFIFIFTNRYLPSFGDKKDGKKVIDENKAITTPYNKNQGTSEENVTSKPDLPVGSSTPVASTNDTITKEEIPLEELESELGSIDQIFFDGIEKLYNVISFNQADEVLFRMEKYVKQSVSKDIKTCEVVAVNKDNDLVTLTLVMPDGNFIGVEVKIESNKVSNVIFKQITEIK